ncbi:MAG TPA: Ni/Fe-hydrogenase, b-type cytochrome subunit [Desulfuromonadales bacterium]|nr:Ni/Fe-hydrogenase, b-type cytochrome subunit [Desulfuromonadales bacterium]
MLEIHYVWEWPVRIVHWINALCIVLLSITGIYIAHPFTVGSGTGFYLMGWMRFIHFTAGYLFLLAVISRFIWMLIGNHHASWKAFFPWITPKGRENFVKMFRYYTFTGSKISHESGHNPVAATAYLGIIMLYVLQVLSGFALYGQAAPGGFWDSTLGWVFLLIDNQNLRLGHHLVMWLLIGFFINHIYSAWLMDVKQRNGTISGIFSGFRYVDPDEQ